MYKSKVEKLVEEAEKAQSTARQWKMVAEARLALLEEVASAYRTTALRFRSATAGVVPSAPTLPAVPPRNSSGEKLYRLILSTDMIVRAGCDVLGPILLDALDAEAIITSALPLIHDETVDQPDEDIDDIDDIFGRSNTAIVSALDQSDVAMLDQHQPSDSDSDEEDDAKSEEEVQSEDERIDSAVALIPFKTTMKSFD